MSLGLLRSYNEGSLISDFYIFDTLSIFSVLLIGGVSFLVALYSFSYFKYACLQEKIDAASVKQFYIFMNLFVATMLAVSLLDNIAWVWIAVEGTTLSSALLLGLYNKSSSLEAAWKYIIICTVGIVIALLGIVLFLTSIVDANGLDTLSLKALASHDIVFNFSLLKIAFVFIFIGYGTKVGLAPMHTWLPDTYANAGAPVSALLSAVLSPLVLLQILRFKNTVDFSLSSGDFTNGLFIFFGTLTILIAAFSLVNQHDFQRLLAYSSLENVGIIAIAIGLGTELALFAVFLQIVFHALAKSLLFFAAGNLNLKFATTKIIKIKGAINYLPLTGVMIVLGSLAITGVPPLALFVSKFMIIKELLGASLVLSVIVLILFTLVFASFFKYFGSMLYGSLEEVQDHKSIELIQERPDSKFIYLPMLLIFVAIFVFGLHLPNNFVLFIRDVVEVVIS